jgi:hypothetical protein
MDGGSSEESEARFAAYVEALGVLGHADRQQPMHDYCLGLLMPIERKERRTDGGGNGTRTSQTPIVAFIRFCRFLQRVGVVVAIALYRIAAVWTI